GKLGVQATVKGVAGAWKELTDGVNTMSDNLTRQMRNISEVAKAVATGDLSTKITVEVRGEILELKNTINSMVDQLSSFSSEVTRVAREVGVEGKLGAQANVPEAAGIWRELTDNVNKLAANLTTQVRAIGEVATAVTKGDLTRSIAVEARGELAKLRDDINAMIGNLKTTTLLNAEQDWLKTNLTQFTSKLQGQRDLLAVGNMILSELAPLIKAQHGVFYVLAEENNEQALKLLASYAYKDRKSLANRFRPGEGLIGQCILEKKRILVTNVPSDYVKISSGLGEAAPMSLVVLPVLFEDNVKAVVELAAFNEFTPIQLTLLEQLMENLGVILNTIGATVRTEELLKESQTMSEELQNQQEELQQTNEELEEKAHLLETQNQEVERKNSEIEVARKDLEGKAEQLAITSKYKSEFLANMSHELRTPLNSLLILSKMLADNSDGNLTSKQVEHAQTIHGAGYELLALINDILDLAKIESGTMSVEVAASSFEDLEKWAERSFRQLADDKKLGFAVRRDAGLPPVIHSDAGRLQQVLKNLLSNAFKFTQEGNITLSMSVARQGWSTEHPILRQAKSVIAFSVNDTGIGIAEDKQKVVFEAFQQADGTTSRKYGGTGLGLSISREIARLLGGELRLESTPGKGSTFTLYLPESFVSPGITRIRDGRAPQSLPAPSVPAREYHDDSIQPDVSAFMPSEVPDDRDDIQPGDRVLLTIED
ncbi:MAG: ATP-binding protein, partial [candidate division Zixibacteria bacterium]|nr:ATP-binding protein [candidate division Zixibacteria bacterium]